MSHEEKPRPVTHCTEATILLAARDQLRRQRDWVNSDQTAAKWMSPPAAFALTQMADACERAAKRAERKR